MEEREMVTVTLLGIPVALWQQADQESKDLMREFALILLSEDNVESSVPVRLKDLIEELERSYGSLTNVQTARLQQAGQSGEAVIDRLDYRLPRSVGPDVKRLATALDEADEYCMAGQHLLSLATSPVSKAFREWFFDEINRQLEGGLPVPWSDSTFAAAVRESSDR